MKPTFVIFMILVAIAVAVLTTSAAVSFALWDWQWFWESWTGIRIAVLLGVAGGGASR